MTNITDINTMQSVLESIRNMNPSDLSAVAEAVKAQRSYHAQMKTMTFRVGDTITFNAGPKRGGIIEAVVKRVNTKSVTVIATKSKMEWRVHSSFLKRT